ncbi:MFS transporter [Halosolutus halophilus]|uniref:MFS transporter n=1 Tax=Halosolutus halophilus TaxID=1552990 RepID=UPI0022351AAC|nr:MFS transporter [Halosolutus halophilus]
MRRIRSRLPTVLGDLRSNPAFLRLLAGRLVTNAGDSLYYIAAMWLVFELTGSPLYTGIAGFLVRAPSALSFLTGPLVDRWSLRRVLVGTQLTNGVLVLAVPFAAWTGHLSVWVILAVLPVVTLVNQFVYPAQNAALPRMIEEENLAKANSLLSAAYQGADMTFNAASGVLIAVVGAVTLFLIDSVTFGVALLLFAGVTVPTSADLVDVAPDTTVDDADADAHDAADTTVDDAVSSGGYLADLREGFAYVRGSLLVVLLIGVVVANFAAGALLGVLPAFAATVGGPDAYGFLMAVYAGGTLAGTLLASRVDDRPLGRFAVVSNVLTGILLAVALALAWFPATIGLFFLTFVPVGAFNVLFFTMLQSAVDDDLLGRVSSLITSVATVAIPVGSAVGGAVAGVIGSRFVMYWWAVGNLFFGLYVAVRPGLRSLPPAPDITADLLQVGTRADATAEGTDGSTASDTPRATD